jgi:predicted MPP superfamily phosphohydrolase
MAYVLVFLAIVLAIAAAIHLYLWQRLVRDTTARGWRRRAGGLAVLAGALLMPVAPLLTGGPSWLEVAFAWPAYLWLAVMFYLFVVLLVLEVPVLVARLVLRRWRPHPAAAPTAPVPALVPAAPPAARPTAAVPAAGVPPPPPAADPDPDHDPGRRLLLRRTAAIAAGVAATGITGYGVSRAYAPPRVTRLAVPLARLDPRADGLRVAVVADIHVGPLYGGAQTRRLVEIVNRLDADIVTVVGDMVSSEVERVRESVAPLAGLRSRYGAYFVTGNHEYYTGHQEWIEAAEDLGLRVLRNQRVEIAHRGAVLDLAGVNDVTGAEFGDAPDYAAALADRDPARPVVLLAHQPVQAHEAARYGVDLQLSGHTHGGQIYPFHHLVRAVQPVLSGMAEVDGTKVYVTNGAGFWGPPVRVGADPDVTLLELRAG